MNTIVRFSLPALILTCACIATMGGCKSASSEGAADEGDKTAAATVSVEVAAAALHPMNELLDLSGSFVPSQGGSAKLSPAIAGRIAKVLVREGDHVVAGQLLAVIDKRVQAAQQSSATSALAAAKAQAAQSSIVYQSATADLDTSVKSAEIALDQAKLERDSSVAQAKLGYEEALADLSKLKAGARPQELTQAHETTVQAQVARDRAIAEYHRDESLVPDGYVSRRQVEDAKTALDTAESYLTSVRAYESLLKEGARKEEIQATIAHTAALKEAYDSSLLIGNRKVATAESALKQARQGAISLRAKLKDVEIGAATARQKEAEAASASASSALAEIRAPFNGVITKRTLSEGDFADTATPVLEIASEKKQVDFLAGALPEQALRIRAGMDATIGSEPTSVHGTVLSVSPADPNTGLASVRIGCQGKGFTGAFSVAHVVLTAYPNMVTIPDQTIVDRDGKTVVYKVADGVAKQIEIQTGPENGGLTGVVSGVKSGDQLVILGAFELTDGSKVKVVEPDKPAAGEKAGDSDKRESGS